MKTNRWVIFALVFCTLWFLVLPVVNLAIGVVNQERLRRLEHRPHITVWTYLTPGDIATLQADGAKEVILHGWAELTEIRWTAEDEPDTIYVREYLKARRK